MNGMVAVAPGPASPDHHDGRAAAQGSNEGARLFSEHLNTTAGWLLERLRLKRLVKSLILCDAAAGPP